MVHNFDEKQAILAIWKEKAGYQAASNALVRNLTAAESLDAVSISLVFCEPEALTDKRNHNIWLDRLASSSFPEVLRLTEICIPNSVQRLDDQCLMRS